MKTRNPKYTPGLEYLAYYIANGLEHLESDPAKAKKYLEIALEIGRMPSMETKQVRLNATLQIFADYVWSFYGPGKLNGEIFNHALTKAEVRSAVMQRSKDKAFEGDSVDREAVRDIIRAQRRTEHRHGGMNYCALCGGETWHEICGVGNHCVQCNSCSNTEARLRKGGN